MRVPMSRWFQTALCGLVLSFSAQAANPPPSQLFYVPFPEDNQLAGFSGINAAAVDPLAVFVTFSAATDNTVIYYDHWEDGYEKDITNPTQSTTLVFGDGIPGNGYPPGNAADLIPAGTVFSLRNYVQSTTLQSVLDYDARDKVASFKPISLTKTCFPASTNTLMAGCVEVFEQGLWGTEYRVPIGEDMPTSTPTATLTNDADMFGYTGISIMAGSKGATVQIDADNNGAFEQTLTLSEGQTSYVTGVNTGGRVVSDNPVQAVMFCGRPGSSYQSRDTSLLPTYRWSTSYYAPVSTSASYGTCTFLYNPGATAITVSYDYRSSTSGYTTATVSVPAGGNARVNLSPASGTTHYGAYRFYTTGATPPVFYAFCAVDGTNASSGSNQAYDGGFTLVGQPSLTTQVLVSLGLGRDPYSSSSPTQNGNPVWVTTAGNGHTAETVYVDYNGDNAGSITDPNGNKCDVSYSVRELEQLKLFDPDGDQSGMLVYTLNPAVKIAAAWAQDPSLASTGQPGLDVSTLLPPVREGEAAKKSSLANDADGDGSVSAGDTLEYDIRGINSARASIPGPFKVQDNLPSDVIYVAGSTRYRFTVAGSWQAWTSIPDDGSGTAFPLDGAGYSVPGNLGNGQQLQITFQATIKNQAQLTGASITNTGSVEISPYGLVLPINWTDVIYGTIGDRVWIDTDGDGVQDAGENGLSNIDVFADLNNNGVWDTGEPKSTTDVGGNYLLAGLEAGTYIVRVDPADIAAANVGYGSTYDLDGIATSNVATVTLSAAQDRVDADFGYRIGASVGNRVWIDRDADGVQENGEPGINGVRVYLDLNGNGSWTAGEPNTITSGDGSYYIGNLNAGTYTVRVDTTTLPTGSTQTFDLNGALDHAASVTLISAEHRGDLDFGYRGTLSIGDLVWEDLNADGLFTLISSTTYDIINGRIDLNNDGSVNGSDDGFIGTMQIINGYVDIDNDGSTPVDNDDDGSFLGVTIINGGFDVNNSGAISNSDDGSVAYDAYEAGVANVRVYLDIDNDGVFDATEPSAITNSSGAYSIGGLYNATYTVRVDVSTIPSSYVETYDLTAPTTDHAATVTLTGSSRTDVDFGYRNDASLGDTVWNDRNANGVRDAGEPGIEGVVVYIDSDDDNVFDQGVERFDITDINGNYLIENFAAGTYIVRVEFSTLPQGCTQTHDLDSTLDHETSRSLATSENATDVDFGYRASASIGNFVWNDADADGVQDGGELGISGVRVYLDINGNSVFDSATEPSATTDSAGAYTIGNLLPGVFTARVDATTLPANHVQTYDLEGALDHSATFSLSAAQVRTDIDFGYTPRVTIGDFVWNDANANGQQNGGETGIQGVTVTAFNASNDTITATTTTGSGGAYSFNLMPGTYYLVFDTPAGYARTLADQGADASDSDAALATGRTSNITLTGGQSNLTIDAGFYQPAAISGFVMADTNNDNVADAPINGVTLTLYTDPNGDGNPSDGVVYGSPALSQPDGSYSFTNLIPGSYVVVQTQPSGYFTVSDVDATTPGDDAANSSITDNRIPVTVIAGESDTGNNFLEEQPGSISGTVLKDTDGDNDGDLPISGVVIRLLDSLGSPVLDGFGQPVTTITDTNGNYSFSGLVPGNYCVSEDQPTNYNSVSDSDGPNDNVIGNVTPITVVAGNNDGGNNFIEIELGVISGYVRRDDDNNGTGDTALGGVVLNLLDSSGNPVLDGFGAPIQVATNASGFYQFTLVPVGSYRVSQNQPAGYGSVSDVDGANNNVIGDQTPIVMTPGLVVTNRNFVEIAFGAISGSVLRDVDDNGSGDGPLAGVTLALLDGSGNPVDGDPNTPGVQPVTTTTNSLGGYRFDNLLPGTYQVSETQPSGYGSVSDVDGGNPDLIGNSTPITVNPGQEVGLRDFIEIQLGTISGYVYAGSSPLSGVTLTLLDENGDPVDGDPNAPGVQPVTTVTSSLGYYSFTGVRPGVYQIGQTQPLGYDSFGDVDGGDINIIGDVSPITLLPGQHSQNNNFIETLDTCPDDWAQWKFQHPGETAGGNPDADAYDNFAEFAFAMPYDGGAGSPWFGHTAWIIRPSTLAPGTLEGVFIRPKGAPDNVTYTLQYAASPANPTVWQSLVITPLMISTLDNLDCTETVTIHDLETLTGLTGGTGTVRIKADLDEVPPTGTDHTSYSEVEGWKETPLAVCCRTYNNPYLRETAFTGTVSGVNGQELTFATSSGDLTTLLSGASFYLEVTSGDNEGHRFDIASAAGNTITLANDVALHLGAPFNTLTGPPPVSLTGDTVAIRRHWTLNEVFPPAGFGADLDQSTADQIQVFTGGAWTIYWLYNENDSNPTTSRWVDAADAGMANQGSTIIPPGQGMFFNNRHSATSILAYGEIRPNDFVRPLAAGSNLVGGGYPLDQSASGTAGRAMNLAAGFFGSLDFKTADAFFVWNADATIGAGGYNTYFLLNGAPVQPSLVRWVKTGDSSLLARDSTLLLLGNRSVFLRAKNPLPGYTVPSPWAP